MSLQCFPEETWIFEDMTEFALKNVVVCIKERHDGLDLRDLSADGECLSWGGGDLFGAVGKGREGFDGGGILEFVGKL
jgi:hypothetical protein